jgi:hypothetical protein
MKLNIRLRRRVHPSISMSHTILAAAPVVKPSQKPSVKSVFLLITSPLLGRAQTNEAISLTELHLHLPVCISLTQKVSAPSDGRIRFIHVKKHQGRNGVLRIKAGVIKTSSVA